MKDAVFFIAYILMITTLMAQENRSLVENGSTLTLGMVNAVGYQHIDFPRKNIIIKRGAIADFNNLEGQKVVVTEIRSKKGNTVAVLKRKDRRNFFRFWPTVTADIEKALDNGELKISKTKREESLPGNK